jgi:GntR family transcriptional regulator
LELEREGVVVKRHGSGTYVSEQGSPLARKERLKILSQRIDSLLTEAGHLEIDDEELFKLIRERSETLRR